MGRENTVGRGAESVNRIATPEGGTLREEEVAAALAHAGLERGALDIGPHPDSGHACYVLMADIQQYSAFLAFLATRARTVQDTAVLTGQVQLQLDAEGDTRFWFPGAGVRTT